ncbi:MAG: mucoidy inhibitor MuiA family protein [Mucilaginibacter sp.]
MLKKLLFAGLVLATQAHAEDGQKVASKVQKVTIFLNGAQVTRTASVSISPGTSTLVFENISPYIQEQSVQLHASGDFTILSVKTERNFMHEPAKQKDIADLQAREKALQAKIDLENNLLAVNQEEEDMLLKNQVITGQNTSLDIAKLKQALDFQTERLTGIRRKKLEINSVISSLDSTRQKYEQQINELQSYRGGNTSNILVTVSSKTAQQSDFTLNYVTNGVNWYPTYDIKAKDTKSPLSISYKANVMQQTGEDWRNIKLTLSTGNPSVNATKPELNPYYLNIAPLVTKADAEVSAPPVLNEVVVTGYGVQRKTDIRGLSGKIEGVNVMNSVGSVNVTQSEMQTNVEFAIAEPYTIPSDGKQYTVEIKQADLNATYTYAVAPKLSTNVFLSASVTDWNKYSFLPGQANLFFEGTYIGKSYLNTNNTNDTLKLSLGIDKSIVVTRTLQKELNQKQSIGSNQKDTRDWVIEVKNRKNQPVNLVVEDQVPVAQNSAIEVETQTLSGAEIDTNTGKVTWKMELKPLDDKKLELKYQVKYPKNQMLAIN